MHTTRRQILGGAGALVVLAPWMGWAQESSQLEAKGDGALPSWNDGAAKKAIIDFVRRTTTTGSPDFVPPADRIAVFDNDGTLWPENPLPFEVAFSLELAKARLAAKPELKDSPAYKALAEGDVAALARNQYAHLIQLILDTRGEQTIEAFNKSVENWLATAKHPRFKRPYDACTYQPMQEVLRLLRAHGYKTYIVSGGSQDFMRVWAQRVYGIPPEQVIGTVFKTKYELIDDKPTLTIQPSLALLDDKAAKPVAIHHVIGKVPVICFGNSDGDHAMLQYTTIGRKPALGVIIHHTDAEREYAYDANPKSSGKLVEALAAAPKRGWLVVDMKRDWKTMFAEK